jgi:hypothetical protein
MTLAKTASVSLYVMEETYQIAWLRHSKSFKENFAMYSQVLRKHMSQASSLLRRIPQSHGPSHLNLFHHTDPLRNRFMSADIPTAKRQKMDAKVSTPDHSAHSQMKTLKASIGHWNT